MLWPPLSSSLKNEEKNDAQIYEPTHSGCCLKTFHFYAPIKSSFVPVHQGGIDILFSFYPGQTRMKNINKKLLQISRLLCIGKKYLSLLALVHNLLPILANRLPIPNMTAFVNSPRSIVQARAIAPPTKRSLGMFFPTCFPDDFELLSSSNESL